MSIRAINNLFADLLDHSIIMFLDNVLVYSHTRGKYVQLLCMIFDKLREHLFYCKLKTCTVWDEVL